MLVVFFSWVVFFSHFFSDFIFFQGPRSPVRALNSSVLIVNENEIIIPSDSRDLSSSVSPSDKKRQILNRATSDKKSVLFIFLSLGGVIFLIYCFLKFIQKTYLGKSHMNRVNSDLIKILSTCSLRGTASIFIVEAVNSFYVVGVSADTLCLLEKITDKDVIDQLKLQVADQKVTGENFLHLLLSKLGSAKNRNFFGNRTKFDAEVHMDRLKSLSLSNQELNDRTKKEDEK